MTVLQHLNRTEAHQASECPLFSFVRMKLYAMLMKSAYMVLYQVTSAKRKKSTRGHNLSLIKHILVTSNHPKGFPKDTTQK